MFRSIFFYLTFLPWTLFVILTGVPLSFINPDYFHAYSSFWARGVLWLAGVRLVVRGQENLPSGRPAIFMANHQSQFDIPALFVGLSTQFRWLAKKELFEIPLFGLAMRRSEYIPIDRGDRRQARANMAEAAQKISQGTSVVIFPEGTRCEDGTLLPFKKGGFILAIQAQAPIVPVVIRDSGKILPKHHLRLRPGTIHLEILPAVETAGTSLSDRDRLLEQVRQPIAETLEA